MSWMGCWQRSRRRANRPPFAIMKRNRTVSLGYPLPTVRYAAVMGVLGLAFFAWPGRNWAVLAAVNALLVTLLIVDYLLCVSLRGVDIERELADTMSVGDSVPLVWSVENHHRRAIRITVADALWPSLQATRRRFTIDIPASTRSRQRTELHPIRRGRFPLNDITVRIAGPLRLVAKQGTRSVPDTVRVMPAYPSRQQVQRRVRIQRVIESGARTARSNGGGTEFDQLRDYRPGDEFRRMDWASSVRLQRPIIKQFRAEQNQHVVVLLDNGRVMAGTVAGAARVEHAMDAALAVTQTAVALGDRVGMVAFDRSIRAIMASSNASNQVGRAAETMFLLEPELVESAYTVAFSAAAARFRRRSLFVVLTDFSEATVEQSLLPALPILTRKHLVVIAGVYDPQVAEWASGGRHSWPSEVFRQAAAVASFDQRGRAAARLVSAGAVVIDAAPGDLAIRLVDTYVELKGSGRW